MCDNKPKTGMYAPPYYTAFRCIADRCRHSCCIDWEICIDETTYRKYRQMEHLSKTVKESEDGPCFALREDGRCPHLNADGLCQIILNHGEEYLSEICRNHPRFYNAVNNGSVEAGLGIVCEEACRLILEDETPFALNRIGNGDGGEADRDTDFHALPHRDHIIAVIEEQDSYQAAVAALKTEYALSERYTPDQWLDRFLALEMLDAEWETALQGVRGKSVRTSNGEFAQYQIYYKRLLTYFVYRHVGIADSMEELRARLAFAVLSTDMIRSLFEADPVQELDTLIDWARRYSAEIEYSEDNTAELIFAFESGFYQQQG